MDHGVGKYKRRTIKKSKPYSRPPKKTVFSRVTDSFKSFISPFTLGWISSNKNEQVTDVVDSGEEEEMPPEAEVACSSKKADDSSKQAKENVLKTNGQPEVFVTGDTAACSSSDNGGKVVEAAVVTTVEAASNEGSKLVARSTKKSSIVTQLWKNKAEESYPQFSGSDAYSPRFTLKFGTLRDKNRRLETSTLSNGSSRNSSFYNGPTQFGGALNSSMNNFATLNNTSLNTSTLDNSSRYFIPKVQQVKVLPNKRRKVSFVNNKTQQHQQQGSSTPLSSTAEKILKAMERLNTPVADARRIPLSDRKGTPYAVARSRRRRTDFLEQSIVSAKRKPPVSNGMTSSTPARITSQPHASLLVNNSLVTSTPVATDDQLKHKIAKPSSTVVPATASTTEPLPVIFKSPHTPATTAVTSPLSSQIGSSGGSSAGGKMKNKRRTHVSAVNTDEDAQDESLIPLEGAVGLPLPTTLPSFKFDKPASTSTPAVGLKSAVATSASNDATPKVDKTVKKTGSAINFNFATPKPLTSEESQTIKETPPKKDMPAFSFSKPAVVPESNSDVIKTSSTDDVTSTSGTSLSAVPIEKKGLGLFSTSSQALDPGLKKGSVMDLLGKPSTPVTKPSQPSTAAPVKKWECEICMLHNNDDVMKCPACEAPKPGAKKTVEKKRVSFGLPQSLQTVEAGSKKEEPSSTTPTKAPAASAPAKNWSCPVCMVSNKADVMACPCCGEAKPGASKPTAPEKPSSSLFGAPTSSNKPSSALFGAPKSADKPASGGLFGAPKSDGTNKPVSSLFGAPKSTGDAKPSSGVLFGAPTSSADKPASSSSELKFGFSKPSESSAKSILKPTSTTTDAKKADSTTPEGFIYGPKSESIVKFGATPAPAPVKTDDTATSDVPAVSTTSKPSFGFSAPSSTSKPAPEPAKASSIAFGTPAATKPPVAAAPEPIKTPSFAFGTPAAQKPADAPEPAKAPTFSFGTPADKKPAESTTSETSSSSAASLSITAPKQAPAFTGFGAAAPKPAEASVKTPSFNFGTTKPDTTTKLPAVTSEPSSTGFKLSTAATAGFPATAASDKAETSQLKEATESKAVAPTFQFGVAPKPGDAETTTNAPAPLKTPLAKAPAFGLGNTATSSTTSTGFTGFSTPATQTSSSFGISKPSVSFSNPEKKSSSTSLLGTPTSTSNSAGALFGAGSTTTPAKPSTMFGTGTPNKPTTNSLFGATSSAAAPEKKAGFTFGPKSSTSAPAFNAESSTTSLFGTAKAPAAPATEKPSIFGAASTTQAPVAPTTSMFGNKPAASTTSSIFGAGAAENKLAPKSMFGAAAEKPAQTSSIFGSTSSATPANQTSSATSIFGAQPASSSTDKPGFKFGTGSKPAAAAPSASFTFGATKKSEPAAAAPTMFGNPAAAPAETPAATFSFGQKPADSSASTTGFTFGQKTTSNPSSGNMFGAKTAAPSSEQKPAGFAFGQTQAAPTANAGFQFGVSNTNNSSQSSGGFKFGQGSAQPTFVASAPAANFGGFGATNTASNPSSMFNSGTGAPAAKAPAFGSAPQQSASTGGFNFSASGAAPNLQFSGAPAAPGTPGAFNLGNQANPARNGPQRQVRRATRRLRK